MDKLCTQHDLNKNPIKVDVRQEIDDTYEGKQNKDAVKNQEQTEQSVLQWEMHKQCRANESRTQDTQDHEMT